MYLRYPQVLCDFFSPLFFALFVRRRLHTTAQLRFAIAGGPIGNTIGASRPQPAALVSLFRQAPAWRWWLQRVERSRFVRPVQAAFFAPWRHAAQEGFSRVCLACRVPLRFWFWTSPFSRCCARPFSSYFALLPCFAIPFSAGERPCTSTRSSDVRHPPLYLCEGTGQERHGRMGARSSRLFPAPTGLLFPLRIGLRGTAICPHTSSLTTSLRSLCAYAPFGRGPGEDRLIGRRYFWPMWTHATPLCVPFFFTPGA